MLLICDGTYTSSSKSSDKDIPAETKAINLGLAKVVAERVALVELGDGRDDMTKAVLKSMK
jgi:hypothetical protein